MREYDFEKFLNCDSKITSSNGIKSRMAKARKAEEILKTTLDEVVSDDDRMYESLVELGRHEGTSHNTLQNAVRKYYLFINNKEFPRMKTYCREKHI